MMSFHRGFFIAILLTMEYILRLRACGYSPCQATRTYYDFLRNFGLVELVEFIESLERENHVD